MSLPQTHDNAREAAWQWYKGRDNGAPRDESKKMLQGTRVMQTKKHCKGRDNSRDASKAALQGRRQRKGSDCPCIVVVDASYNNINIPSHTFFSSLNDVDLSHSMLVDCCMICCWGCDHIAAV